LKILQTCPIGYGMSRELASQPLFAAERQAQIVELIAAQGKVLTSQLTALLRVSEPTLRKDLSALEQRGLLRRTHGGAIAPRAPLEREPEVRYSQNLAAKRSIALACIQEAGEGDSVFLDSGTTVQQIAREFARAQRRITVVTNSPKAAAEVASVHSITHILLGGEFRPLGGSLTGPLTIGNLNMFTISIAFIGCSGITNDGITVYSLAESQLKAAVIARAQRVIVPLDHTKVGVTDFTRVCAPDQIDVVVTDLENEMLRSLCESKGIRLVVAS
jgi:DeoR/GlpR family transcriptional regulator of sugar metabolism